MNDRTFARHLPGQIKVFGVAHVRIIVGLFDEAEGFRHRPDVPSTIIFLQDSVLLFQASGWHL